MNQHTFTRFAAAAASMATAVLTSIVIATPAQAAVAPEPDVGASSTTVSMTTSPTERGTDWRQIGLGAAGGIVLAGAGAVALGASRRELRGAHPA